MQLFLNQLLQEAGLGGVAKRDQRCGGRAMVLVTVTHGQLAGLRARPSRSTLSDEVLETLQQNWMPARPLTVEGLMQGGLTFMSKRIDAEQGVYCCQQLARSAPLLSYLSSDALLASGARPPVSLLTQPSAQALQRTSVRPVARHPPLHI